MLAKQWRTTIHLMHTDTTEAPVDALKYAKLRAKELGAEVTLTGNFPKNAAAQELCSLAIRECTSNCIRHAGGTRIFADCRLVQNTVSCLHGKKTDFLLQEVFARLILGCI